MTASRVAPAGPVRLLPPPQRLRAARTSTLAERLAARLPEGWPLKYLLVGLPVWWVLGFSSLAFIVMAVPMALELRRVYHRGELHLPPAFSLWALFLAWQVLGLAMIGNSPPGTHPGSSSGQLLSIGYTLISYAAITVLLLYVGTLSMERVSQGAIARWMGWYFLTVCAGGYLGMLAPHLSFKSAFEYVLPRGVTSDSFVKALVHPTAAQVQSVIGSADARPAAPFGYTNTWGNALSIVLVWFVVAWVLPARGWRRVLWAVVAASSLVPVIYSLNRGLWIGLGVTVFWVLGRQLLRGNLGAVLTVLSAMAAAAIGFALSPLSSVVTGRLQHGVSDDIRAFVAGLSISAIKHSPILGYGSNRHADGSSSSIAVGPTPSCHNCGDVATGSTGQLWSLLFNQGVVGSLLFFGFFLAILCVYWRQRGSIAEAALVTIVLTYVYMLFYSALPVAPGLTMIAVAMLWRQATADRARDLRERVRAG